MFKKNTIHEMLCDSLGQDAQGVCRQDGIVVFVPDLLPGERALVKIVKTEKRYAYGRVEQRLNDSPDRRGPFCPIAKRCGGCVCQHMTYEATLEYKRAQVESLLLRGGGVAITVPPVLGMDHPYHYRNKGMYPVGMSHGQAVSGFFAPRSHDIISLPETGCPIQDEASSDAVRLILDWIRSYAIPVYDEKTHRGIVRHIMTRCTKSGELMVGIIAADRKLPQFDALLASLRKHLPQLKTVFLSVNTKPGNTILGEEIHTLWGAPTLQDTLSDLSFTISPLSFFQVNAVQTEKLYQLAVDYAGLTGTETVVDAYCGTGTISLLLARRAGKVIGIEIVDAAIQNAIQNAQRNGIQNARFFTGATEHILPELVADGLSPDVIVLDPPRKGCDPAVLDAIIAAGPKRVVYVSCGPSTLARDVAHLTQHGYTVSAVQPVDMFCWTSSIETVALLQLCG